MRLSSLLVLLLALLLLPPGLRGTGARPLDPSAPAPFPISVCSSGCDFTTIQGAIAAAPPGATVRVGPGIYRENLIIDKSLTIVGSGMDATRIIGQAMGRPVVLIRGRAQGAGMKTEIEVRLEGLELTGARGYCYYWPVCADGLLLLGPTRVTLAESTVSGNGWGGIVALDEVQLTLEHVILGDNHRDQLSLRGRAQVEVREAEFLRGDDAGISLWDQAQATILGSEILDNRYYGVVLHDSAQATLEGNLIRGNRGDGVSLRDVARAVLLANEIKENTGDGVELQGEAQASLIRNQVLENHGDGVVIWAEASATLTKNTLIGNRNGLLLGKDLEGEGAAPLTLGTLRIRENTIRENAGWGITLFSAECGFAGAPEPPRLPLTGEGNEVVGNGRGDLCPGDYPWPEGFLVAVGGDGD